MTKAGSLILTGLGVLAWGLGASMALASNCRADPNRCRGKPGYKTGARPLWTVPLAGQVDTADRLILEGHGVGKQFVPTVARPAPRETSPAPSMIPINQPLLSRLTFKPFGREERATGDRSKEKLKITCNPGAAPAGVTLEGNWRSPFAAILVLEVDGDGAAGFRAGFGPARQEPVSFIDLGNGITKLPIEGVAEPGGRLTIACPAEAGSFLLTAVRLTPLQPENAAYPRAAWAWRPALWLEHPDDLIARASALRVGHLYVAVDIDGDHGLMNAGRFADFVTAAHTAGLRITVVEGDAGMALPAGRAKALARQRSLAEYQSSAAAVARIDGLQYDIEPYLLPEFPGDPDAVMRGWAETIRALQEAAFTDLEMVLPFWLPSNAPAVRHVLPALKAARSGIVAMAYRTDIEEIQGAAEPLLAWSSEARLRARIALEAGPLPDETSRLYIRAPKGELWTSKHADAQAQARLFEKAGTNPDGSSFAFSHEMVAPASRVSFLGDKERFLKAVEAAQSALRAWPSFAGMALHGAID